MQALSRLNPWHKLQETYAFDQLGVRVPALLASPWVARGVAKIDGESPVFDHTSLLRYLTDKWGLGPLGLRSAQANSIGALIAATRRPDSDLIAGIDMPAVKPVDPQLEDAAFGITEHDKGLQMLAVFLWLEKAVVETLPRISTLIRWLQGAAFMAASYSRRIRHWACGGDRKPRASVGEPDKIHTDTVSARDDVAWFLMRRKQDAISVLSEEIKVEGIRRDHAVRTLAAMTRRPFHKEPDGHLAARQWLQRHGHR